MKRVLWIDSTDEDYILWRFVLWYLRSTNESLILICNAGELRYVPEMFSMKQDACWGLASLLLELVLCSFNVALTI